MLRKPLTSHQWFHQQVKVAALSHSDMLDSETSLSKSHTHRAAPTLVLGWLILQRPAVNTAVLLCTVSMFP